MTQISGLGPSAGTPKPRPSASVATESPTLLPGDHVALTAPSNLFHLTDFKPEAGSKLKIHNGRFKGHGFGGHAVVNRFDDKGMDLQVNAKKLIFGVTVRLWMEKQDDGTVKFFGKRVDGGQKEGEPSEGSALLKMTHQEPNRTVFEAPDGKQVVVSAGRESKDGKSFPTMTIRYDQYSITLRPDKP